MKLVVGLGNPGNKYQSTRHNVGFWWSDIFAHAESVTFSEEAKFHGQLTRIRARSFDVWVLKPSTYMNESGRSVHAVCNFYDLSANDVLVVHDDLDLDPGVVKLKNGGGHGGHNGLRDIGRQMGFDFWRLRIGVGHPGDKRLVSNFVLSSPSQDEEAAMMSAIDRSLKVRDRILDGRTEGAMLAMHSENP